MVVATEVVGLGVVIIVVVGRMVVATEVVGLGVVVIIVVGISVVGIVVVGFREVRIDLVGRIGATVVAGLGVRRITAEI
jgi:hypothetical protein